MTNREVFDRLEDIVDQQLDGGRLIDAIREFGNELAGSAHEAEALRLERVAQFWDNDKRDIAPTQARDFRRMAAEKRAATV